jgi:hypothetical protein
MRRLLPIFIFTALVMGVNVSATDYALSLNGIDQRVMYANDASLDKLNAKSDYTIEIWVKPDSNVVHNKVFLKRYYSFALTFYRDSLYNGVQTVSEADDVDDTRRFYFTHYTADGGGGFSNIYVNAIDGCIKLHEWNHIVVVSNSSENTFKMYVNGTDVTRRPQTALALESNPVSGDYTANLYLSYGGSGTFAKMLVDKIRIKDQVVDVATTQQSINDPAYEVDDNTVALFNFNEGAGFETVNEVTAVNAVFSTYPTGGTLASWVEIPVSGLNSISMPSLNIFPNPTSEYLRINTNSNSLINNIVITDLVGKLVESIDVNSVSSTEVNVANLNKGVYFISIGTDKGKVSRKLVIE